MQDIHNMMQVGDEVRCYHYPLLWVDICTKSQLNILLYIQLNL